MTIKKRYEALLLSASALALVATGAPAIAQVDEDAPIEEVVVVGSRSQKPRTATDSPVPIDSFSSREFRSLGNAADVTDNLKTLIPSFTATPATGDGSAFVRPTSLRGMAPDQTLVLVNGKRRHRTALVQFFAPAAGNGSHGVDVGMIPSIALKRVEVLRDGAAAQYGSDAIAGVINFVLNDSNEGGEVIAQYGQFYEGEESWSIAATAGLPLGDTGFFNISAEYVDNEALSRGIQRPNAQALIDAGVVGVGADAPFGDAPLVQTWGRPETSGARLFINSGVELSETAEFYVHGNYAETEGRYRFFYRNGTHPDVVDGDGVQIPPHPTIVDLIEQGLTSSIIETGYTPFLDGDQTDFSIVGGLRGEFTGEWFYDVSVAFGKNELDYFLNNTTNPSLGVVNGEPAQRDFDVGAYEQEELNFNADFSKALSDSINFAFGAEYREETFIAIQGEPNSFEGQGSNGLGGTNPESAGEFSRDNWAVYADVEHDVSDELLLQYALRYEDFSDFGGTLNGKIAGRYKVSDSFTLRGAFSTGFHAPTPGQSNIRTVITTFDGVTGEQIEEGLISATSPDAILAGGRELTEENAINYSAGFTTDLGENTTLTVDFYRIEVDDRIYRTRDITLDPGLPSERTISFYTNAIDTRSQGVDIVLTSAFNWSVDATTDFTFAANINDFEVTGQRSFTAPSGEVVTPVSDALVEDIENNYPDFRFVATANTIFQEKWNFMVRANYYGSHYDERGTIGAATNPSAEIDPIVYFDLELGYQANENLRFVAGAANVFDSFVDEIGPPNANRLSVGLQYPRRTVANYEGGSWYVRASYRF